MIQGTRNQSIMLFLPSPSIPLLLFLAFLLAPSLLLLVSPEDGLLLSLRLLKGKLLYDTPKPLIPLTTTSQELRIEREMICLASSQDRKMKVR